MKLNKGSAQFGSAALRVRLASMSAALLCASAVVAIGAKAQEVQQDVAAAARQQRAKKATQAQSSAHAEPHIYTTEDLQRPHILSEEDSARVVARKQDPVTSASATAEAKPAAPSDAANVSAGESLGAVARRFRQEKRERAVAQASRIPAASQFHLEIPSAALAGISPAVLSAVAPPVLRQQRAASRVGPLVLRRDPFSRPSPSLARKRLDSANALAAVGISARPLAEPPASPKNNSPRSAIAKSAASNGMTVSAGGVLARPVRPATSLLRGTATIQAGDSLWKLSRRYSGRGARWPEWLQRNPGLADPRSLKVGMRLVVPVSEDRSPPGMATPPPLVRTVTVARGDSLWKISAVGYGDGAHWPCVARANPQLRDARMIHPGQIVALPAACGAVAAAASASAR